MNGAKFWNGLNNHTHIRPIQTNDLIGKELWKFMENEDISREKEFLLKNLWKLRKLQKLKEFENFREKTKFSTMWKKTNDSKESELLSKIRRYS